MPDALVPLDSTPLTGRGKRAHSERSIPHSDARRRGLARRAVEHWTAGLLALALWACGNSSAPADTGAARKGMDELHAMLIRPPAESTSDKQDAWLARQRETMARLRKGDRELGLLALAEFQKDPKANEEMRIALLDVAAHCAPENTRPVLEKLAMEYDGVSSLGLRTEAAGFLADTSPAAAVALFEPVLREARHHTTYPPQEQLLRMWIAAARQTTAPSDDLLVHIATDIEQTSDARYVAIQELARVHTPLARKALETVLVESTSDGLLRRKAAQAVRDGLPQAEACAILQRVAEHESDGSFIAFLADMLEKSCP